MKKTSLAVFAVILSLCIFYSCQKQDDSIALNNPAEALNTDLAREYFYTNLGKNGANVVKNVGDKISSDIKKNYKIPIFKKAYSSGTNNFSFVEVPLVIINDQLFY